MLKIKDNVDLKELEKFGFEPRYSEFTGKIKSYAYVNEKIEVENRLIPFHRDYNEYSEINREYYNSNIVDVLYDLIQARISSEGGIVWI